MSTCEAKRGPKMMQKLLGKSKHFLNSPRWVVLLISSFYQSTKIVLEDSWLQISIQIYEKRVRKQDPKKVWRIERKRSLKS